MGDHQLLRRIEGKIEKIEDRIEDKIEEIGGSLKKRIGQLIGNEEMEAVGRFQERGSDPHDQPQPARSAEDSPRTPEQVAPRKHRPNRKAHKNQVQQHASLRPPPNGSLAAKMKGSTGHPPQDGAAQSRTRALNGKSKALKSRVPRRAHT